MARVAVIEATNELVDCSCSGAVNNYAKEEQFGQHVPATVATVLSFHTVSFFHKQ